MLTLYVAMAQGAIFPGKLHITNSDGAGEIDGGVFWSIQVARTLAPFSFCWFVNCILTYVIQNYPQLLRVTDGCDDGAILVGLYIHIAVGLDSFELQSS